MRRLRRPAGPRASYRAASSTKGLSMLPKGLHYSNCARLTSKRSGEEAGYGGPRSQGHTGPCMLSWAWFVQVLDSIAWSFCSQNEQGSIAEKKMCTLRVLFSCATCFKLFVLWHVYHSLLCGGQRTTWESQFSSCTVWVPGIELRSSSLEKGSLT